MKPVLTINGQAIQVDSVLHRRCYTAEKNIPIGPATLVIGQTLYQIKIFRVVEYDAATLVLFSIAGNPTSQLGFSEGTCVTCRGSISGECFVANNKRCLDCGPLFDKTLSKEKTANRPEEEIRKDQDRRTTEGKRRRNGTTGYSGGDGMHGIY